MKRHWFVSPCWTEGKGPEEIAAAHDDCLTRAARHFDTWGFGVAAATAVRDKQGFLTVTMICYLDKDEGDVTTTRSGAAFREFVKGYQPADKGSSLP